MDEILRWPPVIWMARGVIIIVVGGGSFTVCLYLARFFRPKNFWKLITAELPEFQRVGGSVTLLGQELEATATLDTALVREIQVLERRISTLETQVKDLTSLGLTTLKGIKSGENGHA